MYNMNIILDIETIIFLSVHSVPTTFSWQYNMMDVACDNFRQRL